MMRIRTCIEYTLNKAITHFIQHYQDANSRTSKLARKMWQLYQIRERNALTHTIEVNYIDNGVYRVLSRFERNEEGTTTL